MSQEAIPVFFLGVTGYVGESLLSRLVKLLPNAHITALIRSESVVPAFKAAGVHEVIHGSHKDLEIIQAASRKAELVINTADCDDVDLTAAVLAGLKERFQETGRRPVLIHTSGTGVLADAAGGTLDPAVAAAAYDDANEEQIKNIPTTAAHRPVDNLIFAADQAGIVDGWIITPPMIYGPSTGPLPRESMAVPITVKLALQLKGLVRLADGTSTWDNVHMEDLLDVYELFIKNALSAETRATRAPPYSRFILVSSDKYTHGELVKIVADTLFKLGAIPSAEVKQVTLEEGIAIHPMMKFLGTNSFAIPSKARKLGWKPKHLNWRADVAVDVERILKSLSNA
ncbi:NAD(P)-binding protein [Exidia glandulosa HHB12029]|uniref:NAD(P)-binding protein n=1 Tax=Exidia glandulosa HHB12029 TaxID=1314781 RepID=A0A165MKM3_EXIGL|nr:NAD(P)-binding protein [Exidia glandulosa HHB12029]